MKTDIFKIETPKEPPNFGSVIYAQLAERAEASRLPGETPEQCRVRFMETAEGRRLLEAYSEERDAKLKQLGR